MEIAETLYGAIVKPESELNLEFSESPRSVTVIALGETKDNSFTYDQNNIIVPKEEGTYIYQISADWKKGHVSYIIKFIVKNE